MIEDLTNAFNEFMDVAIDKLSLEEIEACHELYEKYLDLAYQTLLQEIKEDSQHPDCLPYIPSEGF